MIFINSSNEGNIWEPMKDMCAALAVMFSLLDSNSMFVQQEMGMRSCFALIFRNFLFFISTVQVNSFFKMSCFFWWLRFELCQSLLPPFQRSRLIWNFFKISSDLVQCRHPYVKNLFNFFLQRKVPRYPKRMDEMVIWVGLVAGAPKGREKLLISGRTLSPLKKHAEQKHAIKTQHMLYFWKAGVQGCQIGHSHVSIPFNSAPAHSTHNAKKALCIIISGEIPEN